LQKTICEPPPNELDLVFYLTRTAWPHLKASHGVVVNTASLNGLLSFKTPGSLAHTTAKAGIIGMTRQLAIEWREHGIRANSISPGLIETNETREQLKDPVWASAMLGSFSIGCSAATSPVAKCWTTSGGSARCGGRVSAVSGLQ
jgi:NAD(P)-dependent dehydrogenase (short-subunit alcohol dehydrogenase family)